MSIEALIWLYRDGEPSSIELADVLKAFGTAVVALEAELGCLRLEFGSPPDACDVSVGTDAVETGRARSLMIFRPIGHPALWQSILQILATSHSILFFSNDTTPLLWDLQSVRHFPEDLIAELGTPVCVRTPADIIARQQL